jgi:hypothetical protein
LGIQFFADHIRALTESFDKILGDVGTSYFGKFEGTFSFQGLSEVNPANRGLLIIKKASRGYP